MPYYNRHRHNHMSATDLLLNCILEGGAFFPRLNSKRVSVTRTCENLIGEMVPCPHAPGILNERVKKT